MNLDHFYLSSSKKNICGTVYWTENPFSVLPSRGFQRVLDRESLLGTSAERIPILWRAARSMQRDLIGETWEGIPMADEAEKGFSAQQAVTKLWHRRPACGFHRLLILFFCLALVLCTVGCRKVDTRFNVLSFRDPDHRDLYTQPFEPGSFFINAQRNYEIVFRIPPTLIGGEVSGEALSQKAPYTKMVESPDEVNSETDTPPQNAILMSQIIHIKVFWRPLPGTTYAESSQTNASILYCLITGSDAISYEGAGFVYFRPSRDGRILQGKIESSSLFPTRFSGDSDDIFGSCRLTGSFTAEDDNAGVASALHEIRSRLGPPVSSDQKTPPY